MDTAIVSNNAAARSFESVHVPYIGDNSAPADALGSELACAQTVRHGQVIIAILMYVRASIEVT